VTPSTTTTPTPTPTPSTSEVALQALVFMESADDAVFGADPNTDIQRYMFNNGASSWFGFQSGSGVNGANASDLLIYMDWPGFINGTSNVPAALTALVPHGTTTGNIWYSIWVPHSLLNNSSQVYSQIEINFAGSPTTLTPTNTDSTLRSIDVVYNGSNWPNGTYRVFSNNGGFNVGSIGVVDTTSNYFKGGTLI